MTAQHGPEDWADAAAEELALRNGAAVAYVVSQWLANGEDMSMPAITEALVRQIAAANGMAWRIGDAAISDLASQHAGLRVPPLGLTAPADDSRRLAEAVDLIFTSDHEQLVERTERIARSEPARAAKRSLQEALRRRGVMEWVRVVQPDACDACSEMVGQVRPIEVLFTDHPNCRCSLRARVSETWGDTVREQSLQLRKTTSSGVRVSSGLVFGPVSKGRKS
jgi:hypothetical protein